MAERMLGTYEALDLIPSTKKKKKERGGEKIKEFQINPQI
jgi:hypothetical protein